LPIVLSKIPKIINDKKVHVLVIDDGSHDQTFQVCQDNDVWVIKHGIRLGGGAALKTGYILAHYSGIDTLVTMDADGQHNPETITTLVKPILSKKADFVIGSRVLGSSVSPPLFRKTGLLIFNKLISLLVGITITDCSSGFRVLNTVMLKNIPLHQSQYHTAELIIEASKRQFRIVEQPIIIMKRISGKSKKGHNLIYGGRFLATLITTWLR